MMESVWSSTIILLLTAILVQCSTAIDYHPEVDNSLEHGILRGRVRTNCTCGGVNRNLGRIMNSNETEINEWPMIVGLIVLEKDICGGTILTPRHILTAGHCLQNPETGKHYENQEIIVLLGAHYIDVANSSIYSEGYTDFTDAKEIRTPEQIIIHPNFVWYTLVNDIGFIIISPVKFSPIIQPVCLPTQQMFEPSGKTFKIIGWGYSATNGTYTKELRESNTFGYSKQHCRTTLQVLPLFSETENEETAKIKGICTFANGTGQCMGDSGGPLLWVDPDTNRYSLAGIISFGLGECLTNVEISTDLSHYLNWIQQTIADTFPEEKTCAKRA